MKKYIPNILTIIRFCLIPLICVLIFTRHFLLAFIVFTLSGITDILDGLIARKFNLVSNFGKLMDPLADKLTQITILTSLVILNIIPIWILIIVICKEFVLISGASFLYGKDVVVYSKWYGKMATVLFYLAIIISLLSEQFHLPSPISDIDIYLYYLAIISTIFALIMYVKNIYKKGFIDKSELDKTVNKL